MLEQDLTGKAAIATTLLIHRRGQLGEIKTHTRRETPAGYKFPPLMEDARDNHYVSAQGETMTAYLKPVLGAYTIDGLHLMVIPDAYPDIDGQRGNIPDISALSSGDLRIVLQMGADAAQTMLDSLPNVDHVVMGLHYAPKDTYTPKDPSADKSRLKQRLNLFPDHMLVHVIGYDRKEIEETPRVKVIKDSDFRGRTADAMHALTEELFEHEIVKNIFSKDPAFHELFVHTRDARGRLRFKMIQGNLGFNNPELPGILQKIHTHARRLYEELGKCFFAFDDEVNKFIEDPEDHGRYKLLPIEDRTAKVSEYIDKRSHWLSPGSQRGIRLLARNAITAQAVLDRVGDKDQSVEGKTDYRSSSREKLETNRFWSHKGLSYSMVWSAQRGDNGIEWIFGFDIPIFSVEGIPQSSPIMDIIITKEEGAISNEELHGVQAREITVINTLLNKGTIYQTGTTTPDKV